MSGASPSHDPPAGPSEDGLRAPDALAALAGVRPRLIELPDDAATRRLGAALADALSPGTVLGLVGELGAGKTTLMQGLVAALGDERPATSPTYTLVHLHETDPLVVHVDLYRLEGVAELETLGYWDYVEDGDALVCVEWIDRIPQAWPGRGVVCELSYAAGGAGRRAALWSLDDALELDSLDIHSLDRGEEPT
jgi:tRNA threonylcarbamoyl adenosine modification protein YjeE